MYIIRVQKAGWPAVWCLMVQHEVLTSLRSVAFYSSRVFVQRFTSNKATSSSNSNSSSLPTRITPTHEVRFVRRSFQVPSMYSKTCSAFNANV